jgi:drug/metabolite transporter (DMT)-like permease
MAELEAPEIIVSDDPAAAADRNPLKGILLVIAATLTFALADVTTKHLAVRLNVPLVVAVRYGVNLLLLLIFLLPRHGAALFRTEKTGMVILRGGFLAFASLTMGLALQRMPVAETVAIIYIAPILVMLLSVVLLKEKVGMAGWIGACIGFTGVLLIVRPGSGLVPLGVAFAAANAFASAAYHLTTRSLARTESAMAMMVWTAIVGTVIFGGMLPWSLGGAVPTWGDAVLLVGLGVLATLGHYLFTLAYREARASLLAPVNYLHLVWAAALGWLVFAQVPDGLGLVGMGMVVAAGLAVVVRASKG